MKTRLFPTAAGAILLSLGLASPAIAARMHLTYTIYLGYLAGLNVDAEVMMTADRYQITATVMPQKWISWALPWTAKSSAEGRFDNGTVRPEQHRSVASWGKRVRKVALDFDGDGKVAVVLEPPTLDPNREPVPESLKVGAIDPVSTVAAMALAMNQSQGCAPSIPVFDGHRRFDIRSERQADATLAASRYSAYAGPVVVCRLTFVTIAGGYRDGERSRFWQTPEPGKPRPPVDVWLARVGPDLPPLPVYASSQSILGWVTVYLSQFRVED